MNTPCIALDIGGVSMYLHLDRCLHALGWDASGIPDSVLAVAGLLEEGKVSENEVLAAFHRETGGRFSDSEVVSAWNLILGEAVSGMTELVEEFTGLGYRFIFFSDTSRLHLLQIYRTLPFAHRVTGGIFSFEVGERKPHDAMYDAFETQYGTPFFYADDKPGNIEAGRNRGWDSHLFETFGTGAAGFREKLQRKLRLP
jgi:putative hydrolase of the HAD superfamily